MSPRNRILAISLTLLAVLGACRGPRDPDLEAKAARARERQAAPAPPHPAPSPPGSASGESGPSRVASTQKTYGEAEIKAILGKLPGDGPALLMRLETGLGTITGTLAAREAPQTVTNLVALATAQRPWRDPDNQEEVSARFYDGLTFHRTIDHFLIQTGNPSAGSVHAGGPGWTLPRERGLAEGFSQAGTLGMVDSGTESHGSQFFITLKPAKNLDEKYTPFGRCQNLDLVERIGNAPKHPAGEKENSPTRPVDPVRLRKLDIVRGRAP
jgi:peptidyl-prolyl cis-trans isomerase A (cyclophilin A)